MYSPGQNPTITHNTHDNCSECNMVDTSTLSFMEIDNKSDQVDNLSSLMSGLELKNQICVICKSTTIDKINNICGYGCVYNCHFKCLNKWFMYKRHDTFCVMCDRPYSSTYIESVLSSMSKAARVLLA